MTKTYIDLVQNASFGVQLSSKKGSDVTVRSRCSEFVVAKLSRFVAFLKFHSCNHNEEEL